MESKKLTEICNPKQWKTIAQTEMLDAGYPVYGANGIIGYYNSYNHEFPTVLITCRGATCGSLNISKPYSYINGNAMALDNVIEELDEKYLYYYLKSRGFKDVISGSAQPQITIQNLAKIIISYPSLDEQQKIVNILDKADEIRTKKKLANDKLDEFLKSTFIDMFGTLTKNENNFPTKQLQDVANKITDGSHFSPKTVESSKYPYVTVKDVCSDNINFDQCKFISRIDYENLVKNGCKPEINDVLFSKDGTVGKVSLVDYNKEFVVLSSLAIIRPNINIINPYYLKWALKNPEFLQTALNEKTGVAIRRIILKTLKTLNILLPPLEEQNKFAKIVEKVEEQKQKNERIIEQMDNLFNALSQKAFKGEL